VRPFHSKNSFLVELDLVGGGTSDWGREIIASKNKSPKIEGTPSNISQNGEAIF
jgi:hypothetical protein